MNTRQIDYVTEDFYESLSFMDGEMPDLDTVRELFYEDGLLVNMSFGKPITYSAESFARTRWKIRSAEGPANTIYAARVIFKNGCFRQGGPAHQRL